MSIPTHKFSGNIMPTLRLGSLTRRGQVRSFEYILLGANVTVLLTTLIIHQSFSVLERKQMIPPRAIAVTTQTPSLLRTVMDTINHIVQF